MAEGGGTSKPKKLIKIIAKELHLCTLLPNDACSKFYSDTHRGSVLGRNVKQDWYLDRVARCRIEAMRGGKRPASLNLCASCKPIPSSQRDRNVDNNTRKRKAYLQCSDRTAQIKEQSVIKRQRVNTRSLCPASR